MATGREEAGITYLHTVLVERDVRVRFFEICIRQDHALLEHHCGLDDRNYAAGTFEMADITLDRADEERVLRTTTSTQRFIYTSDFDGVTDFGTSSVTFTEPAFGWV
jgi:hypothetical protein